MDLSFLLRQVCRSGRGLSALGIAAAASLVPGVSVADEAARVIVKFRQATPDMRILSVAPPTERAMVLGMRLGVAMNAGIALSDRMQVMRAEGVTSEDLAARLARQPEVEFAVVDRRKRALAVPNDPLYQMGGTNGPAAGQWYLRPPAGQTPSAINAEAAWDVTTGSSNVVVAVVDSGIRSDHADLLPVSQGGNVLPGYDFIANPSTANDGDGRDADPTDPGDFITQQENAPGGAHPGCGVSNSSWHGTEVAALIGATTNNGFGMASVGRNVRVLPVRVLGKCGGFDSDIVAGMRWAAGLDVPGVPANQTPARVVNLSLGGAGSCSAIYASTVAELNAAGTTVIASAGNSSGSSAGQAVSEPANCAGVIAVAAVRHVGTKVGFSDFGPEIALSAPGGNCVDIATGSACQYPVLSARNVGTTVPVAGSSDFSDSFRITVGTSFSSPLVAGTAALMLSVRPGSTPAQLRSWLQQSARPFPTTGGDNGDGTVVEQCTPPRFDAQGRPVGQFQCYCTTQTCGAGMLDAAGAVRLAAAASPAPTPTPAPAPTPAVPAPSTGGGGGGGGGALGWPWALALFAASAALRLVRRHDTAS